MNLQVMFVHILLLVKCHYGYHHQNSWNPGYSYYNQHKIPQDVMVDAVNNLALKLLAIHNENNDNNIAISPYGALTVLVALGEGLRGEAAHEIQWAANIPSDISVIRVGLRDIHRHLKSYFIPEEGFLSGLTLSHDNVTLHQEYENILKFYGFDTNSFNSALYPEIATTQKTEITPPPTPTTEKNDREEETTTSVGTTTLPPETITETDRLIRSEPTTVLVDAMTTTERSDGRENLPESSTLTVPTTTNRESTTVPIITTSTDTSTALPPEITSTETTTTEVLTTTVKEQEEKTSSSKTTRSVSETATFLSTTQEISSEATNLETESSSTTTEITPIPTREKNDREEETTTAVGTTSLPPTETTTAEEQEEKASSSKTTRSVTETTTFLSTTQETSTLTTNLETESSPTTTERFTTVESSEQPENTSTEEEYTKLETESSTSSETSTEITTTSDSDRLVVESTTINKLNIPDSNNEILRRTTRSVVDYIIARYYDDHSITQRPPPTRPENERNNNNNGGLNFLVNGKYRESNISYMTYDTVLPFHYSQHLHTLALRFPLDSNKYYLLLLLPEHEANIDQVICNLRLNTDLRHIINNLRFTRVRAQIPSFMLKGYVVLTSTFQKMGVKKVFEPRQADFSPMTEDKDIYVTNIEQAITVTIRNYMDPSKMNDHRYLYDSEPVYFKADHPFLYFVIDSEIDIVLMAGKISNPLNSRIR